MGVLDEVAARYGLGRVVGDPEVLHGGVNRLTRLSTTDGTFAVHELLGLPEGLDVVRRCQQVHELEVAAEAAGVALAEPVPLPDGTACALVDGAAGPVVVHRWVDASPVDVDAAGAGFHRSLGAMLGRLHGVGAAGSVEDDVLAVRPTVEDWRALARAGGFDAIGAAADDLVAAAGRLDAWDAEAPARLFSHRDLTSQNVLDLGGTAVLIDWESAGPVGPGSEVGRTALDHGLGEPHRSEELLAFLRGYASAAPLPPVGHDWVTLWTTGLIVFAWSCARSCVEATAPASLLAFQASVVAQTPAELRRRLSMADELVDRFAAAAVLVG